MASRSSPTADRVRWRSRMPFARDAMPWSTTSTGASWKCCARLPKPPKTKRKRCRTNFGTKSNPDSNPSEIKLRRRTKARNESRVEKNKVAFVFPGQGSQYVGMGKALCEQFSVARTTLEEAEDELHFPLGRICFSGPEAELTLTENTQPAILTISTAVLRVLISE